MRIPGLKKARAATRWIRSRLVGGTIILGYHRIVKIDTDPFGLCVSPEHFAEHLQVLCSLARPVGLRTLVGELRDRRMPQRAVVLTIDDGYADVFYQARPLLQHYEVPFTVFVTTGFSGRAFWWDNLASMILGSSEVTSAFNLVGDGFQFSWQAPTTTANAPENKVRLKLLRNLQKYLASLAAPNRQAMLDQLAQITGRPAGVEPLARGLQPEELVQLAASDLAEIGAHSVSHPALRELPIAAQESEIRNSRTWLEEIVDRPVTMFSFPHGSYSPTTQNIVQKAGFVCACASHNDLARSGSDFFALPRFWVPDVDGRTFGRWLAHWSGY